MSRSDQARVVTAADPNASQFISFPIVHAGQAAMAGSQNWRAFEDGIGERNPWQSRYWLLAVIVHLAVASLFLLELSRPEAKRVEEAAIEMVTPPAPPVVEPPPPKPAEATEPPKPHPIVQRVIPKPVPKPRPPTPTQSIAARPVPQIPQETPAPPPAPAQAAPPADFVGKLYAHLNANKNYPRDLARARIGGTAMLRFTMDHQGRVLSYRIEKSSGNARLDAEVSAMIQRAQPLPIPPPDMADPQEITIPILFNPH
jgi:protein TonB